jgi:PEP-CTERM motif
MAKGVTMMRTILLGLAASAAFVAPANAAVVLFDTFDAEAGGTDSLNHTAFANFLVEDGTVDVVRDPNGFFISCVTGSCVDLDGSSNDGGMLITRNAYSFSAGDLITLELQVSGNQVGLVIPQFAGADGLELGFRSAGAAITFSDRTFESALLGSGNGGTIVASESFIGGGVGHDVPFGFVRTSFRAMEAGSLFAFARTSSADNVGPIIDNFSLSIAAVPEPATWGMMILGFGFAGGAMRARKRSVRFATATA